MTVILKETLSHTFLDRSTATPNSIGFQFKDRDWKKVSFQEFYQNVRKTAYGLISVGIKPGDTIAILSGTRFECSVVEFACLGARAVSVPIFPNLSLQDIEGVLLNCEAQVVIVDQAAQLEKIFSIREKNHLLLKQLKKIIVIDQAALRIVEHTRGVISFQQLSELGSSEEAKDKDQFEKNLKLAKPDDLLTICYTSGTTGAPKGAMLTHRNLMSALSDCERALRGAIVPNEEVLLTFLPFSQILGKIELYAGQVFGWKQCFAESSERVLANCKEVHPTILFAVPRFFERIQSMLESRLTPRSKKRKGLGQSLVRMVSRFKSAKRLLLKLIARDYEIKLKFAICGGAPLSPDLLSYFETLGIQILEGFGLTETSGPIAFNTLAQIKIGSVGKPLSEVSIRFAKDGEILVKSAKLFKGYYRNAVATRHVLKDGWFATGDIGYIDQEGYLFITDRKKDLIVMSTGRKVAPQKIECLARQFPLLNEIVVQGEKQSFVSAIITLKRAETIRYAIENDILFSSFQDLCRHPKINAVVDKIVAQMNEKLASYERVRGFVIIPDEFDVETGELTPSLKVKRTLISKRFRKEVAHLYQ